LSVFAGNIVPRRRVHRQRPKREIRTCNLYALLRFNRHAIIYGRRSTSSHFNR